MQHFSVFGSITAFISIVIGAGIFAIPAKVSDVGWIPGVLLLCSFGVLSYVCAYFYDAVLRKSRTLSTETAPLLPDTQDPTLNGNTVEVEEEEAVTEIHAAARKYMGLPGDILAYLSIEVLGTGGATVYLVLVAELLMKIVDDAGLGAHLDLQWYITFVGGGIALIHLLFDSTWFNNYASVSSAVTGILFVLGIALETLFLNYPSEPRDTDIAKFSVETFFPFWQPLPFPFNFHVAIPSILHRMQRPTKFRYTAAWTCVAVSAIYISTGVLGYWAYGNTVQAPITDSFETTGLVIGVNAALAANLIISHLLVLYMLETRLQHWFLKENISHSVWPHVFNKYWWYTALIRLGCVAFA